MECSLIQAGKILIHINKSKKKENTTNKELWKEKSVCRVCFILENDRPRGWETEAS